jgi:hypothetical protein
MNVQIGMGCENENLCEMIGWGLAIIAAVVLLSFIISLWRSSRRDKH